MQSFDFESFFLKFRYPFLILLVGLIILTGGFLFYKSGGIAETKVEVLGNSSQNVGMGIVTADISGEVITPGVYKLAEGSRIDDLLVAAGGLSVNADRSWTDKYLNRAAKLTDGQKVYIPSTNEHSMNAIAKVGGGDQTISSSNPSDSSALININTASLNQLDSLPGIGQVYGQNIIEHRPYSTVEELLSKGILKSSVYNKVKDLVTVY